jgi:RNA polymerase sigma factor (sigma-70 family)
VLHQLRSLAENGDDERFNDQQLLERFLRHREDAAFTMLIQRHGRLVLSAIRRILSEEADVEDAFQTTFLVLLRRAPSVRWQESIGNWLFGVAHRIAVRVRANALRRRCRESEAGRERQQPEEISADLSWREALGLLHEELDRLPTKYRLPLLLCCLEGKGREEVARAFGCSVNAIKWRLERGRVLLRNRLMRRGVAISGALLAAVVSAPEVKGVAPALVQATLNAAKTVDLPASVDALMNAAAPARRASDVRLLVGVLLTAILLAVAAGWALPPPRTRPPKPAAPETERRQPPLPAPADAKASVIVRGRLLDPDGKPVNGARLFSPHFVNSSPRGGGDIRIVSRGISDVDGRFRFDFPRSDIPKGGIASFLAAADGYGVDCFDLPIGDFSLELALRLVKDQPIKGRIRNLEGTPVVVQVSVLSSSLPRQTASSIPPPMPGGNTGPFPVGKPVACGFLRVMGPGNPPALIKRVTSPSNE